ncbi:MAG: SMC-Scp complex subunit ScpB [Armatimonadota bacterium]|nr:SMC-Scp complex subunit ScpB [Armatimonadota bacterium]
METENNALRNGELKSAVECLLFVSTEPVSVKEMAAALQIEEDQSQVELAVEELRQDMAGRGGLQIVRVAGGYQMCTRQEYSECVTRLLSPSKHKLSRAALETLAVIAYRQPVTQPEIEAVRGVNVDGVMKTLTDHNLIREVGRKQSPGRPILYATTREFLQRFGLNDIHDLPDVDGLGAEPEDGGQQSLFEPAEAPAQEPVESADTLREAFAEAEGSHAEGPRPEPWMGENVIPSPLMGEG